MIIFLFGKKKEKSREDIIAEAAEVKEVETEKKEDSVSTGDPKLDIELTKIKGQLEALGEVRKATSERFSRISEQMGELRGMITDLNKTISKIEVGATKAIDIVESVQPEKLMIEVKKEDAKVEAARAQIESTEARMSDMMEEVKKMRDHMNVYKGLEQVMKLNDEMKDELSEMRKMQVTIQKHADRVETMFLEVNKKFVEFEKFNDVVKDMKRQFDKIEQDFDKMKVNIDNKSDKKEIVSLVDRFKDFEKHTDNVLKLLDERSKNVKQDLFEEFNKIKMILEKKYDVDFKAEGEKLGEEEGKEASGEEKKGFMSKVTSKFSGKEKKEDRTIVDKPIEGEEDSESGETEGEAEEKKPAEEESPEKPPAEEPAEKKESEA